MTDCETLRLYPSPGRPRITAPGSLLKQRWTEQKSSGLPRKSHHGEVAFTTILTDPNLRNSEHPLSREIFEDSQFARKCLACESFSSRMTIVTVCESHASGLRYRELLLANVSDFACLFYVETSLAY